MTDELNNNTEVLQDEIIADTASIAIEDAGHESAPSLAEKKARSMGWTPKSEFRGDPAKWCSAEEFVRRGEEFIPFLKSKVSKQESELAELRAQMREFGERYTKVEQATYHRAIKELSAKRREAVELGDTQAFDAVDQEIDKLKSDMRTTPRVAQNDFAETYKAWEERNSEWVNDPVMGSYAEEIGEVLAKRGIVGAKLLDAVEKEVRAKFAHRFTKSNTNPRRDTAPSVESGSTVRKGGGTSYGDMPESARKECLKMANNFFENEADREKFKKDYAKNYFENK